MRTRERGEGNWWGVVNSLDRMAAGPARRRVGDNSHLEDHRDFLVAPGGEAMMWAERDRFIRRSMMTGLVSRAVVGFGSFWGTKEGGVHRQFERVRREEKDC
jgi:hypothetical protein